jgi:hypothetical protein
MAVNRVRVVWSGAPIVGGGLSTFYFNQFAGTPSQQVAAVAAFLNATNDQRGSAISWATEADVASLELDGRLSGFSTVTPATGVGTATGDVLPRASQGLLRILSTLILGGRLLRGRLFLPGPTETMNSSAGAPLAIYTDDYNAAAAALIGDGSTDWVVFSQKYAAIASVSTASTWDRWATLRSRRD